MADLRTIGGGKEQPGEAGRRVLVPNSIHLVRTLQQMTVLYSQMADQKASMLMGASFVVFTLSMGQMHSGALFAPFALLAFAAFFAAVFAVLSVLPKVTHADGPVSETDNLLFFGVFTGMSEEEFSDRVVDRLTDDEVLCRTMLRDIHQNGQVLQRKKYRYLAYAYRIFLAGLVLSFGAFLLEIGAGRLG